MGHKKKKKPRCGSLQFWHRKRAKRIYPRIRNFVTKKTPTLLGFCGHKAGMTHIIAVDNRAKSSTKGEEIRIPVTVLETPNIKVAGIRLYSKDAYGFHVFSDIFSDDLDASLGRKINLPKKKVAQQKLQDINLSKVADVRVLANTQPTKKKTPELTEIAIGGEEVNAKLEYAKSILGKEVAIKDVFKDGELLDVHAVTKGKGIQGVIKRFGVRRKHHKTEKGVRRIGTLGAIVPGRTRWSKAHPGQMGFHTRTEYNKQLIRLADAKNTEITPDGGFINYGVVNSAYALIAGSVAGPRKRLVQLTHASRPSKKPHKQISEIIEVSRRSQQ